MARRGIIIYGHPRNHKIGEIRSFANKLFALKNFTSIKRNGRTEYHLEFESDGPILFELAHQIRNRFGVNAQVKYLTIPKKEKPHSWNPKDFGNPYITKALESNSFAPKHVDEKHADQRLAQQSAPKTTRKLRIDLELNDITTLLNYLKYRPINTQQRKRYRESNPDLLVNSKNDSNRSTFVAQDILFDKQNVEVFVNGQRTTEIQCRVEEKSDAYILHLFYKDTDGHSKTISIAKSEAKEPLHRIRYSDKINSISINGKALAITFEGYEGYKKNKSKGDKESGAYNSSPSVKYEGKPSRQRRTNIVKQTSVIKSDEQITVTVSDESTQDDTSTTLADNFNVEVKYQNDQEHRKTEQDKRESSKDSSNNHLSETENNDLTGSDTSLSELISALIEYANNKERQKTEQDKRESSKDSSNNHPSETENNDLTGSNTSLSELISALIEYANNKEQENKGHQDIDSEPLPHQYNEDVVDQEQQDNKFLDNPNELPFDPNFDEGNAELDVVEDLHTDINNNEAMDVIAHDITRISLFQKFKRVVAILIESIVNLIKSK